MHGDDDNLQKSTESNWKSWSFVGAWLGSLISRNCPNLVGSFYRNSLINSFEGRGSNHSILMATECIEISSSDSDSDPEIEELFRKPSGSRTLPAWASGPARNSTAYASNEGSLTANDYSQGKLRTQSVSNDGIDPSNQLARNVDHSLPWSVNSRISNVSGTDYEKLSSQQALKRTLPASIQLSGPGSKPKESVSNGGYSYSIHARGNFNNPPGSISNKQFRDTHGSTDHSAGAGSTNSKGYAADHSTWANNDDFMMHESNGSRILPPSLMNGMSVPSAHYAGSSDGLFRSGMGEEIHAGSDERLVFQAVLEDMSQPKIEEVTPPDGLLSISLLRHQKIALAWMLQKEKRSVACQGGILADDQGLGKTISMIALIQVQKSLQSSSFENNSKHKTEALNLDDDDDNGMSSLGNGKQETNDVKAVPEVSTSSRSFRRQRPVAGTLVVCPASIVRQWAREIDEKVADEAKLSVLVYHGGSRTKDAAELASFDVVLTTYSIVTNEVPKQPLVDEDDGDEKIGEAYGLAPEFSKKRKKMSNTAGKKGKKGRKGSDTSSFDNECGTLARVRWSRVILDEAQTIKNHRTQVARACCSLRAKTRWCLSGTPIQNTIDDLYSYFRFLKLDPYCEYKSFYSTIKIPISRNSLTGYKKLQAVLRAIMLRRTKGTLLDGKPIIQLPPKLVSLSKVEFSIEERAFYRQLEADSRSQFKAYAAAGTVSQNYANILLMLLRLRQACDHPLLVNGYNAKPERKISVEMAKKLPRDMLINLLNCLETSFAICRVCNDPPEDPVVTMCGHVFCNQCVSDYLTGDENMCPARNCKEQLGSDIIFSRSTLISCLSDDHESLHTYTDSKQISMVMQNQYSSSKIRAVLEILQSHKIKSSSPEMHESTELNGVSSSERAESSSSGFTVVKRTTTYSNSPEGPIKTIIFSQWTRMLDLVESSMNENCVQYRRLDGTMTLNARDKAVKDFNTEPEVTVMLMSLKAGNLGLNMVAACHVILLDLWWNPTTEDQAVDRAHRIGQTRPVTVTRITIKDTVEDRILSLQEDKRKMVASAFGEDHAGASGTRLTVDDLKYLFMGPVNQ